MRCNFLLITLGGLFIPWHIIYKLSPFLAHVLLLNPLLYIINAYRYSFLGVSDINIYYAMVTIVVLTVILFWYALRLLNKGFGLRT